MYRCREWREGERKQQQQQHGAFLLFRLRRERDSESWLFACDTSLRHTFGPGENRPEILFDTREPVFFRSPTGDF
jgi:hypothetical protein